MHCGIFYQWEDMPVEHGISNVIVTNSKSELLPFWVLCSYNEHVLYLMITYAWKLFINGQTEGFKMWLILIICDWKLFDGK